MNKTFYILALSAYIFTAQNTDASRLEYTLEDAYTAQAPQEINTVFEQTAPIMDFTCRYEVVVPKKPGLQINPWNQLVAYTTNPLARNVIAIVNPEFFSTLTDAEKTFVAARFFAQAQEGVAPFGLKLIPWIWVMLSWLITAALFVFITKHTRLAQYPWWARAVFVWAIVVIFNSLIGMKIQEKWRFYIGKKHDTYLHKLVISKTGDRDSAISALMKMDAKIKEALETDKTFFAAHKDYFADEAHALESVDVAQMQNQTHKRTSGCCGGH